MGHTGRLRMVVLLGTVIKSAKPYTFSHVHAYVHKLSQCFKYLYNRCMGAFRNCHRVALCKCARESAQVYKAGDYHVFPKKKNHSILLKSMVLQTRIPFATKKHCTVLKKQTPCMVLHNGRHPPLARKKTVQSFGKKINLAWFTKTEECNLLSGKTNIEWFQSMVYQNRRVLPFARKNKH